MVIALLRSKTISTIVHVESTFSSCLSCFGLSVTAFIFDECWNDALYFSKPYYTLNCSIIRIGTGRCRYCVKADNSNQIDVNRNSCFSRNDSLDIMKAINSYGAYKISYIESFDTNRLLLR